MRGEAKYNSYFAYYLNIRGCKENSKRQAGEDW